MPYRSIHMFSDDLREKEFFTVSAFPCEEGAQIIWIADTGSANHFCFCDTLPCDFFEGMRSCLDMRLATANGIIEPGVQLKVYLTELGSDSRFWVRKDCLSV